MTRIIALFSLTAVFAFAQEPTSNPRLAHPITQEKHLKNVRQLTFGGQNAEAYFSTDGKELSFQSQRDGHTCDAIYRMNADGSNVRMISNGRGTTTCSFISPDGKSIIYASTHLVDSACPPKPDMSAAMSGRSTKHMISSRQIPMAPTQ